MTEPIFFKHAKTASFTIKIVSCLTRLGQIVVMTFGRVVGTL